MRHHLAGVTNPSIGENRVEIYHEESICQYSSHPFPLSHSLQEGGNIFPAPWGAGLRVRGITEHLQRRIFRMYPIMKWVRGI